MYYLVLLLFMVGDSGAATSLSDLYYYIHYSWEHDSVFVIQKQEDHSLVLSINETRDIDTVAVLDFSGDLYRIHSYGFSIAENTFLFDRHHEGTLELQELGFDNKEKSNPISKELHAYRGLHYLINDSTLYSVPYYHKAFDRNSMSYISRIEPDTLKIIQPAFDFQNFPEWEFVPENHLVQYKKQAVDGPDGTVCNIFMYASWLLCIDSDSGRELFATHEPDQLNFPDDLEVEKENGEIVSRTAPDVHNHTVQNIDVAIDDRYVYTLVNGSNMSRLKLIRLAISGGDGIQLDDYMVKSKRVYVYDKSDGTFIREIELDQDIRALSVDEEHLIVLTDEDERIRWIDKSEFNL